MRIAIIPARGGSKRIPRKNIKPFLGVPLLKRCIDILKRSELFSRIVVSTDDSEIAQVACDAGGEVPFLRPKELSGDLIGTGPVVQHTVEALNKGGSRFELVCCVYPAAVLVTTNDYAEAAKIIEQNSDVDFVFTATSFAYPIQRALRRTKQGGCEMIWPDNLSARSQELEPAFHDAGQFYLGRTAAILTNQPVFSDKSRMMLLPRHRSQDIDTLEDWKFAEFLYAFAHKDNRGDFVVSKRH